MAKIHITIRIDEESYKEAKEILSRLGLTFSQAVNIFVNLIRENQGLPFEVKIPNEKTLKIIEDARKGENMIEVENLEELKEILGI